MGSLSRKMSEENGVNTTQRNLISASASHKSDALKKVLFEIENLSDEDFQQLFCIFEAILKIERRKNYGGTDS